MLRIIITTLNKQMHNNLIHKFYDIAANLTDDQFGKPSQQGHYEYSQRDEVIKRAKDIGVTDLLIASGCIEDAKHSYEICKKYENCFATIGVHPCRASEPFNKEKYGGVKKYFQELEAELVRIKDKVVAIGECGLDYDRLSYASKEQMMEVFPYHFQLAEKYSLPMYLHNRNTGNDFYDIVRKNRDKFNTGVVHSFTGPIDEIKQIVELDLYIGINGCSLKTQQNLQALKHIPSERILLETDSPYCEIRKSHSSSSLVRTKFQTKNKRTQGYLLKGRNEPCKIVEVLEVVSSVLGMDEMELSKLAYENSMRLFHPK